MAQQEFKDALKDIVSYMNEWEPQAREDFRYWSLDQWSHADVKALEEEGRPALTFDRTRPIIQAVSGSQVTSRYQALYVPREADLDDIDAVLSKAGSKASRWIQQTGDFEHYESLAFQDTLVSGVGCVEIQIVFDIDSDGRLILKRVPVWEIGWDPASVEPNMLDARYIIRDKWIDEDEVAAIFGQELVDKVIEEAASQPASGVVRDGLTAGGVTSRTTDDPNAYDLKRPRSRDDKVYYDKRTRRIRIYEMQRFERVYKTRIIAPDVDNLEGVMQAAMATLQGQDVEIPRKEVFTKKGQETTDELQRLQQTIDTINLELTQGTGGPLPSPISLEDFPVRRYLRSYHTRGEELLEEDLPFRDFSYLFITAYEDWSEETHRHFFGMMRPMRDPQNYANKFLSQAIHLFTANPKGALIFEKGIVDSVSKMAKEWNRASGLIQAKDGALQSQRPRWAHISSNVSLRGIETLLGHAIGSVPAAVGVNEGYLVGNVQDLRRTSGEALEAVLAQNLKTQVQPFDSLRLYRKKLGRIILHYIQDYMSSEQLTRVVGLDESTFLKAAEGGSLVKEFDVVVEEVPTSPNEQKEVFNTLMESNFLPQLIEQGIPIPPEMADFFPIPAESAQQLKAALTLAFEIQMMNLQMQKMMMQQQMMAAQSGAMPPMQGEESPTPPEQPGQGEPQ